ncbi:Hypothetical predicted protein [Pelobates cultripes]|uniref:Uncharacterized protein n=1 Tax=Pelobates cultripes TaxID=61616 RepID=A0AAD1WFY4_PELCU|nr:Hypothetical predicted protein [Pelobates cultripes]
MGKTRRQGTSGPSGNSPSRKHAGLMDDFLSNPDSFQATRPADKMAAAFPDAESGTDIKLSSAKGEALAQITAELVAISANMFTNRDKAAMVAELRVAIREEILEVRRDLTALEQRVTELESENLQAIQHSQAAHHATARQGSVLLDLRRQVEDLDNRGRRNNIRVRGLPEADNEDLFEALTQLFTHILGEEAPDDFHIERAHRALGPPRRDGLPRDVICCLLSFQLKEAIMRVPRPQTFHDPSVSLYHDLSSLTLDARRALRPLTHILQEKHIPYKWGFAFCLQAKKENTWRSMP